MRSYLYFLLNNMDLNIFYKCGKKTHTRRSRKNQNYKIIDTNKAKDGNDDNI